MGSNWREYQLQDITNWASGGTPSKSNDKYWGGNIPWISASSMNGNRYSNSKLKVTELGLKSGTRLAKKESILLLVRGSILHQKIQVGIAERNVSFNQDVKQITIKDELIEPWYLLFWFMAKKQKLLGLVENTGIGAGKLDTKILQELIIRVPPVEERKRILDFLKALDDKIELNRQANQTLEKMAQVLFKSWFVDFDPVIDNALAAGTNINDFPEPLQKRAELRKNVQQSVNAKKLPEDIRKLFPSEFEESELGWVPKGWVVKTIDELSKINPESWTKKNAPNLVQYVDLANAKNGAVGEIVEYKFDEAPSRARRILETHDTIIGVVRPANRSYAYINKKNLTGSTGFVVVRPVKQSYRSFIYLSLTNDECIDEFTRIADGAAYPAIKPEDVAKSVCVYSSEVILKQFENLAGSMMSKISENEHQVVPLSDLRDTLLPKLISGELRINLKDCL